MDRTGPAHRTARSILVWDLPTRLFHWLLVALLATSYVSGTQGAFVVHFLSGYAVIALVLFRLVWGLVGSDTARFAHFLKGPRAVLDHAAGLLRRDAPDPLELGHNPLGALMVVALLLAVLTQALTGLFTSDDILTDGPFVHLADGRTVSALSSVHRVLINILLAMVALHVAAVLAYRVLRGENLVRPMITGRRPLPEGVAPPEPRQAPLGRALLILLAAAALVTAAVNLL